LISDGGYVVAPPSIHPTGHRYQFASDVREILEMPDVNKLLEWLDQQHNYHSNGTFLDKPLDDAGIVEGERNNRLFQSATVDREQGVPEEVAVVRAQDLNLRVCKPPLPDTEVYGLVQSAYSRAYYQNAAQRLVNGDVLGTVRKVKLTGEQRQELEDSLCELCRETDIYEVCDVFSSVIKRDLVTTAITFLGLVLTYTDRNQVVICYKADSSTGKSYIPLELVSIFPDQGTDILKLAGASPTSFIHEANAEPIYEEGIDDKGKVVRHLKHLVVNLERKILIFKDQPDYRLLAKLRSFLSKDEREAIFKITDRTKSGKNRTKTVVLRGYPTVLYCSAKLLGEDQENTRTFILSPEMSQEKFRDAIDLIIEKETDFDAFQENIKKDPRRKWLADRLESIKAARIREITLTPDDSTYITGEFLKRNPYLVPRYTRDFPRLIALAKGHALLNYTHRRTDKPDVIEANRRDVEVALELYSHIAQANELGIPPQLLQWYTTVLVPIWQSQSEVADRKAILRKHLEIYHQPLDRNRLEREFIPSLESANLVSPEQDPDDKRRVLYAPLRKGPNYASSMCDTGAKPKVSTTPDQLEEMSAPTATITHPGSISPLQPIKEAPTT
jgi:hypothetical protein